MNQDLSIVQLMLNASWVVQAVVAILVLVSVISWAAIFRKVFALKRVNAHNEDFDREFWSGANLNDLYAAAAQSARHGGPMERIFASGMREYHKLRERRIADNPTLLDGARRDEAVDGDGLVLPDAVGAVGGLVFDGRVPPRVEVHHGVRPREVETDATGFETDQKDRHLFCLKSLHDIGAVSGLTVEVTKIDLLRGELRHDEL